MPQIHDHGHCRAAVALNPATGLIELTLQPDTETATVIAMSSRHAAGLAKMLAEAALATVTAKPTGTA